MVSNGFSERVENRSRLPNSLGHFCREDFMKSFPFLRLYQSQAFAAGPDVLVSEQSISTIELQQPAGSLPVSLDKLGERLLEIPNMHFEWDGSAVWVGEGIAENRWQVDCQFYDLGTEIQYVEWRGYCPIEQWDEFTKLFAASLHSDASLSIVGHWIDKEVWLDASGIRKILSIAQQLDGATQ
jgi:hypothetical protein